MVVVGVGLGGIEGLAGGGGGGGSVGGVEVGVGNELSMEPT